MPDDKARVVFDCNVYVQALVNPNGPAANCLELARRCKVESFISQQTLAELKEVLQRPNILRLLPHATSEQIEAFLEDVVAVSTRLRRISVRFEFELNRTTEDSYKVAQTLVCERVGSHRLKSVLRHLTSVPISCGLI